MTSVLETLSWVGGIIALFLFFLIGEFKEWKFIIFSIGVAIIALVAIYTYKNKIRKKDTKQQETLSSYRTLKSYSYNT